MKLLLAFLCLQYGSKLESAEADKKAVKPGETFNITFKVGVDAGYHIYPTREQDGTEATKFLFDKGTVNLLGIVSEPPTKHHKDEFTDYDAIYEPVATFVVRVSVSDKAKPGALKITGKIDGQACNENGCFPMELPFSIAVTVEGGAAPPPQEKRKVTVDSAVFDKDAAKPGQVTRVLVKVTIEKDWHIYSAKPNENVKPTAFTFKDGTIEGAVVEATPRKHEDKVPELNYEYHEGSVWFVVPVKLAAGWKPAEKLTGNIEVMVCDANQCLPPEEIEFTAVAGKVEVPQTAPVKEAPKPAKEPSAPPQDAAAKAASEFQKKGWGWLIGFAIIGGLVSLVQPCVYPLIPITITFFVKQSGESHGRPMLLGAMYGIGIIVTFTLLGFLLVLLMGAGGVSTFASNPWVNLVIAAMFMTFALSMFGLFELQLPQFITGAVASGGPKSGVGGAFTLGLLFAIVSFTCTIPIAATILGIAASAHKWAGLVGMLVYATTMAIPFFLFGAFPLLMRSLPRSGGWLNTVKVTGGFVELGIAMAYIWKADFVWRWGIFYRWVIVAMWVALSGLTCLYLLGAFRMEKDGEPKPLGFTRLMFATFFGFLAVFIAGDAIDMNVGPINTVLPPKELKETLPKDPGTTNQPDEKVPAVTVFERLEEAQAESRKTGKPIFLEFTAGS